MELFETDDYYIVLDGDYSLWCNRKDGKLTAKRGSDLASAWNPICLGEVYGVIGKLRITPESEKLLLIRQKSFIGCLPGGHDVNGITKIAVLPVSSKETPNLGIELCKKHHFGMKTGKVTASPENQQKSLPLQKTWNSIKTATAQVKSNKKKEPKDRDKFDKRVTDELIKMFTDTESFYYSPTGDLTNSIQRQCQQQKDPKLAKEPLWRRVDERFFWNQHMLEEIIESEGSLKDHWIVPVIQGFVNIESCHLDFGDSTTTPETSSNVVLDKKFQTIGITLISRRSRHRAGTRYRRRGVDESGKVANYVETEQIVEYNSHILSFVQVRGSVPVYWSQPGFKYRPPPRLDRGPEETQIAFDKHFTEELTIYGPLIIISLVEKYGKERVIGEAYLDHILNYNSPSLTYIIFDFHEYCRGMRFENVDVLIRSIQEIIRDMMFCWTDKDGVICEQKGAFRVNCIDCLDRTNVVQSHLARKVIELQFTKLGLVVPEGALPLSIHSTLQIMWANNGDSLSRQYAGTAALKGDYTRTGERRLAGMMKDGYNSANRYFMRLFRDVYRQITINLMLGDPLSEDLIQEAEYFESCFQWVAQTSYPPSYINNLPFGLEIHLLCAAVALSRYYLNRFKDAYRQATIDLMLGKPVSQDELGVSPERDMTDNDTNWSEHIKQLIEDCKKILVPNSEVIMGGWALIDADPETGDPGQQDADAILILTRDSYYVAEYDDETDRISKYQRVMLGDLEKIELGPEPSLFKSKYNCIRLNYQFRGQGGYFHMFRSTNIRFFNNMAIFIKSEEDALESLKAICDTFLVALEVLDHKVTFHQGKLERKRSKVSFSQDRTHPFSVLYLDIPSLANIPRNVSEGQLLAIKNAGSKAISNMTSQFAKLNPMTLRSSMRLHKNTPKSQLSTTTPINDSAQRPQFRVESSSDSDEEAVSPLPGNLQEDIVKECDVILRSCGILATGPAIRTSANSQSSLTPLSGEVCESKLEPIEVDDADSLDVNKRQEVKKSLHLDITCETMPLQEISIPEGSSSRTKTPEIHISREDDSYYVNPAEDCTAGTILQRKLSHSSDSIEKRKVAGNIVVDGNSAVLCPNDPTLDSGILPMKTSHSEGAIREFHTTGSPSISPLTSPSTLHKEIVLAPLTKIAKGVQNLGMNIQRATSRHSRPQENPNSEAYKIQQERRRNCRTRIIEL